jgi:alpha-D-xyloside xylohydrolase
MRQTNFYIHDLLDIPKDSSACVWRACRPTGIEAQDGDILLTVPFQKQQPGNDIYPDRETPRKDYLFRLRAYGDEILRLSIGFDQPVMEDSEMLDMRKDLRPTPLRFWRNEMEWSVTDKKDRVRARINFAPLALDHWSDLLPAPEETFDIVFYPKEGKELKISAYDQFQPNRHDAMALAYVEDGGEKQRATISFHADPDECFAGTGERFAKMDLSGRTFQLENQDGQGVNNRRTYKNIPFYYSSRGYGVFAHTTAFTKFSLADQSTRSSQVVVEQPLLDIFLMAGETPERVLYNYRSLTGFPTLLPTWSYGIWMSRMTYFSADEVNEICDRLRAEDYPCDVIHLDTGWFRTDWLCEWKFNEERFPDPKAFLKRLKDNGFRVSLWQLPYVAEGAIQLQEALENKYIAANKKRLNGGSNFSSNDYAGTIDFTSPKATEWYQNLLKNLLDMGVVCIKTDFGEDIHLDADYENMKPELLHNLYPLLYQKAAWEITKKVTGDGIAWSRSSWAGSQRYPLHWGGDAACSWDGMAGSLKGGLHFGLSGFGFWSHDVPGFHSVPDFMNSVISDDLYLRWTQFGVFSSHMRYHGTSKREPYSYPGISDTIRRWFKLRYALIPYLLEQSEKIIRSGYPMVRALLFHFPEDKLVWHIDDQYCFGDDFLVAPVMNAENRRDVYLPEGCWINFFTGIETTGPCWLKDFECPLDEMPVWLRKGASVPVYPEAVSCTDEMDRSKVLRIEADETYKGIGSSVLADLFNGSKKDGSPTLRN